MSDRPQIERWNAENPYRPDNQNDGEFVFYEDHVQALIRAQIAVLEELPVRVTKGNGDGYMDRFIQLKIAALRKELASE